MAGGAAAAVVAFAAAANTRVGGWLGGVRRRRCCYVVQVNDADELFFSIHLLLFLQSAICIYSLVRDDSIGGGDPVQVQGRALRPRSVVFSF